MFEKSLQDKYLPCLVIRGPKIAVEEDTATLPTDKA